MQCEHVLANKHVLRVPKEHGSTIYKIATLNILTMTCVQHGTKQDLNM